MFFFPEKEKCVEKQTRMKKYIPFLDFMINKLEKKNNEVLQCQFKKFHSLRSIISEGKGKTSLHSLNKIEEVILKLITILDYKVSIFKTFVNNMKLHMIF